VEVCPGGMACSGCACGPSGVTHHKPNLHSAQVFHERTSDCQQRHMHYTPTSHANTAAPEHAHLFRRCTMDRAENGCSALPTNLWAAWATWYSTRAFTSTSPSSWAVKSLDVSTCTGKQQASTCMLLWEPRPWTSWCGTNSHRCSSRFEITCRHWSKCAVGLHASVVHVHRGGLKACLHVTT